ncbi:nucleoside-diphosphate sugar epimerase [Acinetobacter sp. NCu2D-2]|uniref:NAD(P)H-binding protein n=1 Tax=Acinetobacter sp. NCu2D-2 TaxID=1608473 RepID=UPI0007CDD449|nr:NAD(P)H-binding protein [Acinetobacter sp. NCu2D-2]ANF81664.1 nucleoside-diphosphate sugar epimerase [Acinetobacter sp. NCu2D-2]
MTYSIESAIVIGATGLVGKTLIKALQNERQCEKITAIVRNYSNELAQYPKVRQFVLEDFLMLNDEDLFGHTHAFSCLGSTLKKAGSKEQFYNIDYVINAHFAELVQQSGAHYLLLSAFGANDQSLFFYNRVKGELEAYIKSLSVNKVSIIRPSLLLGQRSEKRRLEDATQKLYQRFSHLVPNTFKYKPVTAEQVAHTMVDAALNQTLKFQTYDNLAIQKI